MSLIYPSTRNVSVGKLPFLVKRPKPEVFVSNCVRIAVTGVRPLRGKEFRELQTDCLPGTTVHGKPGPP
ncbi:hypothetical protein CEXT_232781 [Caerostris extrusa]|uniref:Uncharacterized protein n=1 Tax=Caerostris extrusa TaxID=172846 RepID=A0AAV4XAW5_CAEEX|nr:hypothetical protein CEXT_232781 [Caerostris extrusa]